MDWVYLEFKNIGLNTLRLQTEGLGNCLNFEKSIKQAIRCVILCIFFPSAGPELL